MLFIAVTEVIYESGTYIENPVLINITDISTVKKTKSSRRPTSIKMKDGSRFYCKDEFDEVKHDI